MQIRSVKDIESKEHSFGLTIRNTTKHFSAAAQEYADAYYNLGSCYEDGVGVTRNNTEALKWYKKCAGDEGCDMGIQLIEGIQQKDGKAVSEVGDYWYYNENRNPEKALKCYEIAAKWGHAEAESQLGYIYLSSTWNDGIKKDTAATSHENGEGEYQIGLILHAPKNVDGAKIYYELAARKGHKRASEALAKLNK